jgi:hypothetical protein
MLIISACSDQFHDHYMRTRKKYPIQFKLARIKYKMKSERVSEEVFIIFYFYLIYKYNFYAE